MNGRAINLSQSGQVSGNSTERVWRERISCERHSCQIISKKSSSQWREMSWLYRGLLFIVFALVRICRSVLTLCKLDQEMMNHRKIPSCGSAKRFETENPMMERKGRKGRRPTPVTNTSVATVSRTVGAGIHEGQIIGQSSYETLDRRRWKPFLENRLRLERL